MKTVPLMQRIGWAAGALLIVVIAIAIAPALWTRYQVHAFTSKLHAGMSADDVKSAAAAMHLEATGHDATQIFVEIREPWTFGSTCSDDYVVVVTLARAHVERWQPIRERLCVKS